LRELKHIELFGVVPPDKSLEALECLPSLETARLQGFPKKEIRRFFADTTVRNEFAPDPSYRSREAVVGCASVPGVTPERYRRAS
jgi:hypothetical protein